MTELRKMGSSAKLLSPPFVACQNHGCILSKHRQVPRNRSPLVECCSVKHEVPLSLLSSSGSSSPLVVSPRMKESQDLRNVLMEAQELRARREYAQLIRKNMQIPANFYLSTDPRKLLQNDYNIIKRKWSNQEQRKQFFRDLSSPRTPQTRVEWVANAAYVPCEKSEFLNDFYNVRHRSKVGRSRSTIRPNTRTRESVSPVRRPHSVDLGIRELYPWVYVVPSKRVTPKDCDELPDEFRRAGIGACFKGKTVGLEC